ncbi:major tail protein [Sarcina ventriculi]
MSEVTKLIKGLKNIHFAPYKNGRFDTPVKVQFAKSLECELSFESENEWADDRIVDTSSEYNGGEGSVTVLGLTKEEHALLFGNTKVKGGVVVNSNDIAPQGAFLFERGKKNSSHSRYYVVYACQCSPATISAETVEDGKASAAEDEINFTIGSLDDGNIYHFIDSDDPTVDDTQKSNWFTEVQFPIELEE